MLVSVLGKGERVHREEKIGHTLCNAARDDV